MAQALLIFKPARNAFLELLAEETGLAGEVSEKYDSIMPGAFA